MEQFLERRGFRRTVFRKAGLQNGTVFRKVGLLNGTVFISVRLQNGTVFRKVRLQNGMVSVEGEVMKFFAFCIQKGTLKQKIDSRISVCGNILRKC